MAPTALVSAGNPTSAGIFAQELQSFVVPLCGEEWVVMDDGDNGNDTENADDKDEAEGS